MTETTATITAPAPPAQASEQARWFLSDCEGNLRIWREDVLRHVTRDEHGEITGYQTPASWEAGDLIAHWDLNTWDPGEDADDDAHRAAAAQIVADHNENAAAEVARLRSELDNARAAAQRDERGWREQYEALSRRATVLNWRTSRLWSAWRSAKRGRAEARVEARAEVAALEDTAAAADAATGRLRADLNTARAFTDFLQAANLRHEIVIQQVREFHEGVGGRCLGCGEAFPCRTLKLLDDTDPRVVQRADAAVAARNAAYGEAQRRFVDLLRPAVTRATLTNALVKHWHLNQGRGHRLGSADAMSLAHVLTEALRAAGLPLHGEADGESLRGEAVGCVAGGDGGAVDG